MGKRREQRLVEAFVPQPAVEALDERMLLRLSGRDVVPRDAMLLSPAQHGQAGELGTVIGNNHSWAIAAGDDGIKLAGDTQARQRRIGDQRQAFASEIVDDCQDAKPPAIGERVREKIQAPALFGPCGNAIGALVPTARLRPDRRR
jgi:hypothetical protein